MITSVSYRKSSSPPPEAYNTSGTFVRLRIEETTTTFNALPNASSTSNSNGKSTTPQKSSFWQNLFRGKTTDTPTTSNPGKSETSVEINAQNNETLRRTQSSDSIASVCSTNSFSFISSPGKYKGRKKGKRIPLPEDTLSRGPPQPAARRKISTLSKLGMKIGLKSKYNLQSCESLHRVNTLERSRPQTPNTNTSSLNRSIRKRRAPPPPATTAQLKSIVAGRELEITPKEAQVLPSTSAQAYGVGHRRCFSEGSDDYSGYVSPKSRYHVRGKRRAPPPPNPFGDPEESQGQVSNVVPWRTKSRVKTKNSPNAVYVEKEVQSETSFLKKPPCSVSLLTHEKAVNDEVKAQLAILKSEADSSPLRLTKPNKNQGGQLLPPEAAPMEPPAKINPRPWYKRSSSKSSTNSVSPDKKKGGKPPPLKLLAKFSDLDREASRIVEENKRRSAEIIYNESTKELISMFNNEFGKNETTLNSDGAVARTSNGPPKIVSPSPAIIAVQQSLIDQTKPGPRDFSNYPIQTPGKLPMVEEPAKKLAVVQPQANSRNTSTSSTTANLTQPAAPLAATPRLSQTSAQIPPRPIPVSLAFPPPRLPEVPPPPDGWSCPRCTLKNEYWRSFCDACHYRHVTGTAVQNITSLFDNVNRQFEMRVQPDESPGSGRPLPAPVPAANLPPKPIPSNSMAKSLPRKNSLGPPCENFLSQLPSKEKLAKEEKLIGIKLIDDPEVEELDIEKLREARVAFFERNKKMPTKSVSQEFKPNNLAGGFGAAKKEMANVLSDSEDDALDTLLEIHQQLNPNMSGTGPQTWKPLNVQKFRPMLESIVESENLYGITNHTYENVDEATMAATNSFMRNIQTQIKDQIRYFEQLSSGENTPEENEDSMDPRQRRELTLDDYMKLGAIPKNFQNGHSSVSGLPSGNGSLSRRHKSESRSNSEANGDHEKSNHEGTLAISKLLRNLEWAIAQGNHRLAASLAHDLALFKVNCVVSKAQAATQPMIIRVYVEDRFMQQGPFQVQVTPSTTVKELKAKIECDWGIPTSFQKWILGRKIAEDDAQTLGFYETVNNSMAFLYLVTPGSQNLEPTPPTRAPVNRAKHPSPVRQISTEPKQLSAPAKMTTPEVIPHDMSQPNSSRNSIPGSVKMTNHVPKVNQVKENNFSDQNGISPHQNENPKNKILEVSKLKLAEEKIVNNRKFLPEPKNAQIKEGPPVEDTVLLPPKKPESYIALVKPGSPEFTTVNIQPDKLNQIKLAADKPAPPPQPPTKDINKNSSKDVTNNNIPSNETVVENSNLKNSKSSKPPKSCSKDKKGAVDKPEPSSVGEKVPRGRKFFRMTSKRKVDQGTSIERDAPIRTVSTSSNSNSASEIPSVKSEVITVNSNIEPKSTMAPKDVKNSQQTNFDTSSAFVAPTLPPISSASSPQKETVPHEILKKISESSVAPRKEAYSSEISNLKGNKSPTSEDQKSSIFSALISSKSSMNWTKPVSPVHPQESVNKSSLLAQEMNISTPEVIFKKCGPQSAPKNEIDTVTPKISLSDVAPRTDKSPHSVSPKDLNVSPVPSTSSAAISKKVESPTPQTSSAAVPKKVECPTPQTSSAAVSKKVESPTPQTSSAAVPKEVASPTPQISPAAVPKKVESPTPQTSSAAIPKKVESPTTPQSPTKQSFSQAASVKTADSQSIPPKLVLPKTSPRVTEDPDIEPNPGRKPQNLNLKLTYFGKPAGSSAVTNYTPDSSLKKTPPMNRGAVKSIGGIFISRIVGNLVAAAEDMNKNRTQPEASPLPRRSSLNEVKPIVLPSSKESFEAKRNSFSGKGANAAKSEKPEETNFNTYKRMVQLMEKEDFIKTVEEVECPVCLSNIPAGDGVTLRDCLHSFCKECLIGAVQYSEEPQVRCPFRDSTYSCDSFLQEREVKGVVPPELYDRHLARSVKLAESKMNNTFHCKTNDCTGWCVFEDDVNVFNCPVCKKRNCLTCQAIHEGENCQEFQRKMAIAAETDEDAKSSRVMLEKMISRGEALDCPACHVVLLKKWGCDWVRCSYCKTEICWVTKGFRWGPNGKGDTSGGCKCGLNGVKCHPKCTYCH